MTKGVSLTSNLILECAKRQIDIDFIDKSKPYAQITYYNVVSNALHLKQLDIKNSDKGFQIAVAIVKAKMKNQINLIKYYARHRECTDREIISIVNQGRMLDSTKGRLTKKSIKIITENVQERLATPTKWRKGKYKLLTIIDEQVLEIVHVIQGIKSNFKGFVGRF